MNRRAFLAAVGAGVAAAPLVVEAAGQTGKVARVGLFHVGLDHVPPSLGGLREALQAFGYEEGRNIVLDWRNLADEDAARKTATEFVRSGVHVIVAFENQTVRAAKSATSQVPIVFLHVTDPVADGLIDSLARPGRNLTGVADSDFDLLPKDLEIYKEFLPRDSRLLLLIDPQDPATTRLLTSVTQAGTQLGLRFSPKEATTRSDITDVFKRIKPGDVHGVFIVSPTLYTKFPSLILELAGQRRLPVPFHRKEWVSRGALFSYGYNFFTVGRSAAAYVDKILKGAKPRDLPVEQPTNFEFAINLKTAKALGLIAPHSIMLRADQVIQ